MPRPLEGLLDDRVEDFAAEVLVRDWATRLCGERKCIWRVDVAENEIEQAITEEHPRLKPSDVFELVT